MRNSWPVPLLTPWPDIFYNKKEETVIFGGSYGLYDCAAGRRKMESLPPERTAAVYPGANSRRGEVWKGLGHPRQCGKARPSPTGGRLPLPEIPRAGGRVRQRDAHAPDEHPLLAGPLPGDGQAMAEGPQRDIALAEYHYFSGRPEQAALEVEP